MIHNVRKAALIISFLAWTCFFGYASSQAQQWKIETIDGFLTAYSSLGDSRLTGIAFDSNGMPHISYYKDEGNPRNRVKHASWDGVTWQKETVEAMWASIGIEQAPNSIATGPENQVHIAYRNVNGTDRNLKHAFWNGSEWMPDFITTIKNNGRWNTIAVDSEGNPHVAYSANDYSIKYAYWDGLAWKIQTVEPAGSFTSTFFMSIVVDKYDNPHIAYYRSANPKALKYAYFDGGKWQKQTVDNSVDSGWYVSLQLDKNGKPHIAYHNRTNRVLKYAYNDSTTWQIQTLPGTGVGQWSSLDLDRRDRPHIAYYDEINTGLKYAGFDGNTWKVETVDNVGTVGLHSFIALSSCDDPFIVYTRRDVNNEAVKVAMPADYGPNPFSLISPANGVSVTAMPKLDWDPSGFRGFGLSHYELWIDNNLYKSNLPADQCSVTLDTPLPDGVHTWRIRAVLAAGGEILSKEIWSFQVDSTPPLAFNLLSPGDNSWTANRQPVLTWQASSDAGSGLAKYQLYIDGAFNLDDIPPSNMTATPSFNLSDGAHTWYINAADNAGNRTKSSQTRTIKVDNTPPTAFSLTAPPNAGWTADTTPTFSWQASSDAGIGLSKYTLVIDGAAVDSISADSTNFTLDDSKALSGGNHTWRIEASDSLGNIRQSVSWTTRIDITPPAAFSLSTPVDSAFVSIPTPTFSWGASQDGQSGFSHYQLWIDSTLSVDNITGTSTAPGAPLSEGIHSWFAMAVDQVGNMKPSNEIRTVIWDPTPPAVFELASPASGDTVTTKKPLFSWNSSQDAGSGLKRYELWIDGVKDRDDISPDSTSAIPASDLVNGAHNWFVKAVDFAENATSSTSIWHFVVDRDIAPPISAITSPADGATIGGDSLAITGTATDGDGAGVQLVEIRIDNGAWQPVSNTGADFGTWEYLWTSFTSGNHTIQSRATDKEGNIETPGAGISVTVNRTTPSVASLIVSPNPAAAGLTTFTIQFDPGAGEIDHITSPLVTFSPPGDTTKFPVQQIGFQNATWTGTANIAAGMNNGAATVQISGVKNFLGNLMSPRSFFGAFLIDTVPPRIDGVSVLPDPAGPGELSVTVAFFDTLRWFDVSTKPIVSFTPASGTPVNLTTISFDSTTGVWTGSASVDSTMGDGVASVSVSGAKDRAGNVMAPVQNAAAFLIDVTPPLPFSLLAPTDSFWTREQQPLLQWAASSDATTGLAQYRLLLNDNLTISDIAPNATSVQPTTPLADAGYRWHAEAVDSVGNVRKSSARVFSIDTTPPVTQITSPAAGDTLEEVVTITGTAGDGPGIGVDSVWVSTDGGATWHPATSTASDFNLWQFTWIFSESGVATLQSRSRDKLGNPEIPGPGVVVNQRNFAPWIATLQDIAVREDSHFTLQVAATDPNPNDTLRFADDSPLFEIDPVTGVIDFTPTNDEVGQHTITISVSDGRLSASTQLVLTVTNTNDPPEAFTLLAPQNNANIDTLNPTLRWQQALDIDVGDTVHYHVHLSSQANFSDTLLLPQTLDTSFTVSGVLKNANTYFWKIIARDLAGAERGSESAFSFKISEMATSVAGRISDQIPTTFGLSQNYPNPFNPETRIRFQLPQASHVRIDIFNIMGQHVATLLNGQKPAGYYEAKWDGRNDFGGRVSSGVYIISMRAADGIQPGRPFVQTRKVLVVE